MLLKINPIFLLTEFDDAVLQNLEMNVNLALARYEALTKEFEAQSLVEGYKEALGEIYETAVPPFYHTYPNSLIVISISVGAGLFTGIFFTLLLSLFSAKIFTKEDFKKALEMNNILVLSKKFLNTKRVKNLLKFNKNNPKLQKDIITINSIGSKLIENINNGNSKSLAFISLNRQEIIFSISFALAHFLSDSNKSATLINYSSKTKRDFRVTVYLCHLRMGTFRFI